MSRGVPTCRILPLIHDRETVRHGERLFLVVGDEDERDAGLVLQPLELDLHVLAQLQIERRQRLVEQQNLGPRRQARASATRCCWPPEIWLPGDS
jgi:hypothetical protein